MPTSGRITAGELARVCSHYDLGEVTSARKLKRGSGQSPKVVLESSTGIFLLKRRAPGRDDPATVAIAHEVQLFLARHGFPTPALLGTRRSNNSMLQLDGRVYELFSFVRGVGYNRSVVQTEQAGLTLSRLHLMLRDLAPSWTPVIGAYHAARGVLQRLATIPSLLQDPQIRETTRALEGLYRQAAETANRFASDWRPDQLIHADWHPGNMIFASDESSRVLAVLDFDSVRKAPPIVDFANAALQFAILRRTGPAAHDAKQKPDEIDLTRFQALCRGYHDANRQPLRPGEVQALPWLMVEALVTEAAVTIAATGKFGPMGGTEMLRLVLRKAQWIEDHAATMIDAAKHA